MVDLKEQLNVYLDQVVDRVDYETVGLRVVDRPSKSPGKRRPGVLLGVAVAAIALVVGIIPLVTDQSEAPPAEELTIDFDGLPGYPLAAADGAYWLAEQVGGPASLLRVDATTLEITDRIPIGDAPTHLFPGPGGLWVLNSNPGELFLVDTSERQVVDSIELKNPTDRGQVMQPVLIGETLWVHKSGNGGSIIAEVDLSSRVVASETSLGGNDPWWADVIDGIIWSYAPSEGLKRFSPTTYELEVFEGTSFGPITNCCVATQDAIWIVHPEGGFFRFDIQSREITDAHNLERPVRPGVVAAGGLWVVSGDYAGDGPVFAVYRIDLATREVTDEIPVAARPSGPVFADGAIWVSHTSGRLSRIDVDSRQVTETFVAGSQEYELAVVDGELWVANRRDGTVARVAR